MKIICIFIANKKYELARVSHITLAGAITFRNTIFSSILLLGTTLVDKYYRINDCGLFGMAKEVPLPIQTPLLQWITNVYSYFSLGNRT